MTLRSLIAPKPVSLLIFAGIFAPMAGALTAVILALAYGGVQSISLWLLLIFYVLTAFGIEAGFHRLFTHRSFKTGPFARRIMGGLGSMAGEGGLFFWVATHRNHHRFSDHDGDPHSPLPGSLKTFVRAHVGWMLEGGPEQQAAIADLRRDPVSRAVDESYLVWFFLGLALPALIGGMAGGGWGAVEGFLWGGLMRVFLCHQFSWCLNSLAHLTGARPYDTNDGSRNVWFLALPTLGAAWHNNHHAYPMSATNDHKWWQLDLSGWVIRAGGAAGLFWDIRRRSGEPR